MGVYHYILDRGRDNIFEGNTGCGGSQLSFESPGKTISQSNNFEINEFTQVGGSLISRGDTLTIKDTFSQDYLYLLNSRAPAYTYKQVVVEDVTININRSNGNALQLVNAAPNFINEDEDDYAIEILRLNGRVVNKNYPNREIEIYNHKIKPLLDLDVSLEFDDILPNVIPETQEFYVAPRI